MNAGTRRRSAWTLLLGLALALATPLPARAQDTWVVRGGRWLDVERGVLVPNSGLVLAGGKITSLSAPDQVENARVLELEPEQTVLPGLFDLHAHYAVDLFGKGRVDEREVNPRLFLAYGVTSTFTAGEVDPEEMMELRRAIDRGEKIGPRIFNSGPYFGTWRRGWNTRMSEQALRREVDEWAERGVAGFKAKGISGLHLRALIDQAHRHGLTVTGHLDSGYRGSVNPRDAITLGIDRVEHFLGGDCMPADKPAYSSLVDIDVESEEFARICRQFIDHGVFFNATLSAFGYYGGQDPEVFDTAAEEQEYFTPWFREQFAKRPPRRQLEAFERIYWVKRKTLKAFYDAGGGHLITTGTDHPSWGQFLAACGLHRELECFVRAGLTPAATLRCATLNGARALGVDARLGSITAGKLADLIVVEGDPLADIENVRAVKWVFRSGVLHDAEELREGAKGKMGPSGEEDEGDWAPR